MSKMAFGKTDHVKIPSLIRNRCTENKTTFCYFIDMQKAFGWVDRDMLFFKLLGYNIDGKNIHVIYMKCKIVFTDKWLNDIQIKPKLRTYILFKK